MKQYTLGWPAVIIATCLLGNPAAGADEGEFQAVVIDGTSTIYAPGYETGHNMLDIERHPNGAIYINAHDSGLFKSTDNAKSWERIAWKYNPGGFGISRDGRIWLVNWTGTHDTSVILILQSSDGGRSWEKLELDCGPFSAGGAEDPYARVLPHDAYTTFIERPDKSLMFSCSMEYSDWDNWLNEDQSRPGLRDVMVRTHDGGKTWGDATIVRQHATETDFAVDPNNPDHILAATRVQRGLLPGEDPATTGCNFGWEYKNGLLIESNDGGRTFQDVPGSMTRCYGHRATILWTKNNVIVVTRQHGCENQQERRALGPNGGWVEAHISLDGGQTWVVDQGQGPGTSTFTKSTAFTLVPPRHGHSYTAPTIELSTNHFLTVYAAGANTKKTDSIRGIHWHIETD